MCVGFILGFIFVPFYMLTIYTHLIPSSVLEGFKHTCDTKKDLIQSWEIGCNRKKRLRELRPWTHRA